MANLKEIARKEAAELDAAQEPDPATASNVAGDTSQQVNQTPGGLCGQCVHSAECPSDERSVTIFCADFTASGSGDTNQQVNQSSGDPDESDADAPDPHCARCRLLGTIFCTVCRWDPRNKYESGLTDQSHPPPTPWDSRLCAV